MGQRPRIITCLERFTPNSSSNDKRKLVSPGHRRPGKPRGKADLPVLLGAPLGEPRVCCAGGPAGLTSCCHLLHLSQHLLFPQFILQQRFPSASLSLVPQPLVSPGSQRTHADGRTGRWSGREGPWKPWSLFYRCPLWP